MFGKVPETIRTALGLEQKEMKGREIAKMR